MEVDKRSRGHAESLKKNPWTHENVMEVDGMSCRCTERWWKFKPMHGKLTTGLVDGPKVVGSWRKIPLMHKIFKDNYSVAQKVDKTWRNDPRTYGKLTEGTMNVFVRSWYRPLTDGLMIVRKVDGRSRDHTESWMKLTDSPAAEWNFLEGPTDTQIVDGS